MHRFTTATLLLLTLAACANTGPVTTDTETATVSDSAPASSESLDSTGGESTADEDLSTSTGAPTTGDLVCRVEPADQCDKTDDFCADADRLCRSAGLNLSDNDPPGTDYCGLLAPSCAQQEPCVRCFEIENYCNQLTGDPSDCDWIPGYCACLVGEPPRL